MWEKIILITFINNRTSIINMSFALTRVLRSRNFRSSLCHIKLVSNMWRAWEWTKRQKPSSEHPSQVLVYKKSSGHSTKQPTSTGFPKCTVHKVLLKMSCVMLQDLRKLHPFRLVSGRYHAHFPDIAISTSANLYIVGELFTWLERHKNQIGRSL